MEKSSSANNSGIGTSGDDDAAAGAPKARSAPGRRGVQRTKSVEKNENMLASAMANLRKTKRPTRRPVKNSSDDGTSTTTAKKAGGGDDAENKSENSRIQNQYHLSPRKRGNDRASFAAAAANRPLLSSDDPTVHYSPGRDKRERRVSYNDGSGYGSPSRASPKQTVRSITDASHNSLFAANLNATSPRAYSPRSSSPPPSDNANNNNNNRSAVSVDGGGSNGTTQKAKTLPASMPLTQPEEEEEKEKEPLQDAVVKQQQGSGGEEEKGISEGNKNSSADPESKATVGSSVSSSSTPNSRAAATNTANHEFLSVNLRKTPKPNDGESSRLQNQYHLSPRKPKSSLNRASFAAMNDRPLMSSDDPVAHYSPRRASYHTTSVGSPKQTVRGVSDGAHNSLFATNLNATSPRTYHHSPRSGNSNSNSIISVSVVGGGGGGGGSGSSAGKQGKNALPSALPLEESKEREGVNLRKTTTTTAAKPDAAETNAASATSAAAAKSAVYDSDSDVEEPWSDDEDETDGWGGDEKGQENSSDAQQAQKAAALFGKSERFPRRASLPSNNSTGANSQSLSVSEHGNNSRRRANNPSSLSASLHVGRNGAPQVATPSNHSTPSSSQRQQRPQERSKSIEKQEDMLESVKASLRHAKKTQDARFKEPQRGRLQRSKSTEANENMLNNAMSQLRRAKRKPKPEKASNELELPELRHGETQSRNIEASTLERPDLRHVERRQQAQGGDDADDRNGDQHGQRGNAMDCDNDAAAGAGATNADKDAGNSSNVEDSNNKDKWKRGQPAERDNGSDPGVPSWKGGGRLPERGGSTDSGMQLRAVPPRNNSDDGNDRPTSYKVALRDADADTDAVPGASDSDDGGVTTDEETVELIEEVTTDEEEVILEEEDAVTTDDEEYIEEVVVTDDEEVFEEEEVIEDEVQEAEKRVSAVERVTHEQEQVAREQEQVSVEGDEDEADGDDEAEDGDEEEESDEKEVDDDQAMNDGKEEDEGEDDEETRRTRAFEAYNRLGKPKRRDFQDTIKSQPQLKITKDDVALLPWDPSNTYVPTRQYFEGERGRAMDSDMDDDAYNKEHRGNSVAPKVERKVAALLAVNSVSDARRASVTLNEQAAKEAAARVSREARAKRVFLWYTRMGQGMTRDKLKKKVATLPKSMEITTEDIDLLEWNKAGTFIMNLAELQKEMLRLKDYRYTDNGERVYETDSSDDDSYY